MNSLDNLLAQVKNGAITVGEALESLPEYMRQSVINSVRSGSLTPMEALESQTKYFNQLGPKQGPNPLQGPPSPSQFIGPPSPNQAYGPFQPGQGFNPIQGPNQTYGPPELQGPPKPSSVYGPPSRAQAYGPFLEGKSGLPNVSLPSASDVGNKIGKFFVDAALTRLKRIPGINTAVEIMRSDPVNVGEDAALRAYMLRTGQPVAGGTTAALSQQEPQAQTRETPFRDPTYAGRDPNLQAYIEANRRNVNYPGRDPYGQSTLDAGRRDVEYPGRDPNQAAYEKAISAAPSTGARATRSPLPSSSSTPTQGATTYYLDRGNGTPLVPMGTALPKNMSQGDQPGGGYIFGVNTPAPTNAIARTMQRGLGIKPQDQSKTEPVDPLTRKSYAPVSASKPDVPSRDTMDYGDRMPPLVAKKDFDMPQGEKRGGSIHGPHMAAGGTPCHSGIINMAVGGRTDHIPMNVMEGSYVLPADIVSGLGEGNTMAGSKILDQMMKTGPAGVKLPSFRASPRFPEPTYTPPRQNPYEPPKVAARGGMMTQSAPSRPVPIVAAGGEYVVPPDAVRELGKGDLNAGHDYLDNFVKYVRGHLVKTLSKLPGPKKD